MSRQRALSRAQLLADPRYTSADVDELIRRCTASGSWIPDPNFPNREDLRQYFINASTEAEMARVREDRQNIRSTTTLTAAQYINMLEEGGDFAHMATPNIRDLHDDVRRALGGLPAPNDPDPEPKAKANKTKNKTKGAGKGKGKGGKGGENAGGEGGDQGDTLPSPLHKANLLKSKVFLGAGVC